ncbi:MAG: CHAT domain-containing protein [Cytophagia bacterium]|nr:CHAT domain-containing protein [Cytophagia bacterium]
MNPTLLFKYFLVLVLCNNLAFAQTKHDKALSKADAQYNQGAFDKATKSYDKFFKKANSKLGQQNKYTPIYYSRQARLSLANGQLVDFNSQIENAIKASITINGESSLTHAYAQIDIAELYLDYGHFKKAREITEVVQQQLKNGQLQDDALKAKVTLVLAEALTGQGFCREALTLLSEVDQFLLSKAVDREQVAEGDKIVKKRIPENELPIRFGNYAQLVTLRAQAYAKMGETTKADSAFVAARNWISKKMNYLGEYSLALVNNNYLHSRLLSDNGLINFSATEKDLGYGNVLNDLKRKTKATHQLALDVYQSYLEQLQKDESDSRFYNVKAEYEKMLDKNFKKNSVHQINFKAIEFDSKLSNQRTRNLENEALKLLSNPALPAHYKTRIKVLEFLSDLSMYKKNYANVELYLNQISDIQKELYGANAPEYHLNRLKLAAYYLNFTNKIDVAGQIYQRSYNEVVALEIGPWQKDHLDILNNLASLYEFNDQYTAAAKTLDKASDVAYSKFSNEDPEYAIELDKIAMLQLKLGLYEKADKNIQKSLAIFEKYRKDETRTEQYVHALETQAKLYGIKGMFDEAQDNLDRTVKMISKSEITFRNELATAEELSSLFIQLGKYSQTDVILNKLIAEYKKQYGTDTYRLIEPLTNKGKLLLLKGDYTETEKIGKQANELALKYYGETSTKTAPSQKLLSDLYYTLGDYDKAEAEIKKALVSQEKQFGRDHIETAKSISQLALIKFHKGDDKKEVEKLMIESRDAMAQRLGKENPQYAEILKNVATLYISEKRFDIAFNSLTIAESIWRAKGGRKNNINLASIFTLTGDVYYQQKNYKKAEEFYIKAKDLYEKFFSVSHPEFVKVQSKLAKVYYMQKDYKRAKKYIEGSLDNYEGFIKSYFPALSEREKAKYWNTIKGDFEFYNTLAFSQLEDFRDLTGKVYNYQLITKALLLSSSIKIRERILNSTDEVLKNQYSAWLQKKETLTLALSMSDQQLLENGIDRVLLEKEVETLEKELSQRSEGFGQGMDNKRITFDEVRKSIAPTDVAIEMVRYRYFNHSLTDSVIYAALYIKPDFKTPKAVLFPDGAKMETRFFKYYRNAIIGKVHDTYSYKVFWEPIQKEIGVVSSVFLSADGIFNQINLESIPTPDNRYVLDNSNIVLVSNTKDIYLNKIKSKNKGSEKVASMFGNPTFYLASSDSDNILPLPGTEKEVSQLQLLFKQNGWVTNQFVEDKAVEQAIKDLNNPKIFHIATHGLYKPSQDISLEKELEGNEALLTQNPLMRTGLLLSGAGDLLEKTDYNYNMENGILTAYEAMNLNLDKTDLVVLSACETGLGDLQAGEGVYGLQRAFLVAGAKVLIMSMFKVDDDATQKLFLKFYLKWLNSGNIRQSFTDAKKELRDEYPEPIYWGAFMMIGLE